MDLFYSYSPKNRYSTNHENCPEIGANNRRWVAPMVEITETIGHIVIMSPADRDENENNLGEFSMFLIVITKL